MVRCNPDEIVTHPDYTDIPKAVWWFRDPQTQRWDESVRALLVNQGRDNEYLIIMRSWTWFHLAAKDTFLCDNPEEYYNAKHITFNPDGTYFWDKEDSRNPEPLTTFFSKKTLPFINALFKELKRRANPPHIEPPQPSFAEVGKVVERIFR